MAINIMYNNVKRFVYETNVKSEMIYMQIDDDEYFIEPDTTDIISISITGVPYESKYIQHERVIGSNKNFKCISFGDFNTKIMSINLRLNNKNMINLQKVV